MMHDLVQRLRHYENTLEHWMGARKVGVGRKNHVLRYFKTALGSFYLPADAVDDLIARHIRKGRIFEPEIVALARKYSREGSVVLDVGANYGQMAVLFSKFVGPAGKVFAFEANPQIYEVLSLNLRENGCTNAVPIFGAVYSSGGSTLRFPKPDLAVQATYGSHGLDPGATTGDEVPTLAIDDLQLGKRVSFIKVDVQGCDLFALRGAQTTIKKDRPSIVFEFEQDLQDKFGTTFQDYIDFVRAIGYRFGRTAYGNNYVVVPDIAELSGRES